MNQISKVRSLLNDALPAILLTGAPNRQYATGAIIDEGMCLVTAERCDYFTDSRYTETAQKQLSAFRRGPGDGGPRRSALHRLHPGRPR